MKLTDLFPLANFTLVCNILEAAKRKLAKRVIKKEPKTTDLLISVYSQLYEEGNLKNQRIMCAFLMAFSVFLRSTELRNIKFSDVNFECMHMSLFIERSKTDIYRDGAWVIISKTGTMLCLVVNLQKYIAWGNF